MPKIKNQLRRYAIIVEVLNRLGEPIKTKTLLQIVCYRLGEPVCKSTIEKDIANLRYDLDIEVHSSRQGLYILEQVDFIERLKKLYDF